MLLTKFLFTLFILLALGGCGFFFDDSSPVCGKPDLKQPNDTVVGYLCYQDQYVSSGAVKTRLLPVRFAKVQILDNATDQIMTESLTEDDGRYQASLSSLLSNREYRLRVLPVGSLSSSDSLVIGASGLPYAISSPRTIFGGVSSLRIDMSIGNEEYAAAFNIFDQFVDAQQYLFATASVASIPPLTALWYEGNISGSYFCPAGYGGVECNGNEQMYVLGAASDSDGFDDSVILHEYGHFVMENFSKDDSPGGAHDPLDTAQDLRLSWSEGFSTAFSSMVKRYHGRSNPDEYLDTNGSGEAIIQFSLEVPQGSSSIFSPNTKALGLANEIAVGVVLYDIIDPPHSDETFDLIEEEPLLWDGLSAIQAASNVSFQDFYESWAGSVLTPVLEPRQIFMLPDDYEFAGTPDTLTALTPPLNMQHSLHVQGDEDWVRVTLQGGQSYTIAVSNELSGALVYFSVYEADGITLATNAIDGNTLTASRSAQFKLATTGDILVKVNRDLVNSQSWVRYGSYILEVK